MSVLKRLSIVASLAIMTTVPAIGQEFKAGDLTIVRPTIRETAPGAPVAGGFMTIRNGGAEQDRLIGGSAGFSDSFEVHEMRMDGDVMKMRQMENGLEIPAGGEVELKHGGYHVMFMGLKERMVAGETRDARLVFEKAGEVVVTFEVVKH
jgi:copper(I)-binding protein